MCKTQSLALSHCAEQVQERPYLNIIFGLAVKTAVNAPHWKATGLSDTSTKLYDAGKIQQNLRVAKCLVLRQAKEGRAGNTCLGYPVGHSCPRLSPCAGTNKAPPSRDPVWCIWLRCLVLPSQMAVVFGCLLDLIDKWREDSAWWCYLCNLCSRMSWLIAQLRKPMLPQWLSYSILAHPPPSRVEQRRHLPFPAKEHPHWDLYVRSNCYLPCLITANHMHLEAPRAGGACCTSQDELGGWQDDLCT